MVSTPSEFGMRLRSSKAKPPSSSFALSGSPSKNTLLLREPVGGWSRNQGILVPWRCEIEGGSANVVAHFGNTAKEEPHFSNINQIMTHPPGKRSTWLKSLISLADRFPSIFRAYSVAPTTSLAMNGSAAVPTSAVE